MAFPISFTGLDELFGIVTDDYNIYFNHLESRLQKLESHYGLATPSSTVPWGRPDTAEFRTPEAVTRAITHEFHLRITEIQHRWEAIRCAERASVEHRLRMHAGEVFHTGLRDVFVGIAQAEAALTISPDLLADNALGNTSPLQLATSPTVPKRKRTRTLRSEPEEVEAVEVTQNDHVKSRRFRDGFVSDHHVSGQ